MSADVPSFSRRALFACGLATTALVVLTTGALAASTPAEQWVSDNIQRGLLILNKKQSPEARRDEFRGFLLSLIDFRAIALYTMGAGRRTASPQEQDQFVTAFKDYAEAVYESYLLKYSGQTLRVTGSVPGRQGESIVSTVLLDPDDPHGQNPYNVAFRVAMVDGRFQIKDASVEGVWLAILEHEDFDSFLGQNNNSVPALISHLQKLTKDLQKG